MSETTAAPPQVIYMPTGRTPAELAEADRQLRESERSLAEQNRARRAEVQRREAQRDKATAERLALVPAWVFSATIEPADRGALVWAFCCGREDAARAAASHPAPMSERQIAARAAELGQDPEMVRYSRRTRESLTQIARQDHETAKAKAKRAIEAARSKARHEIEAAIIAEDDGVSEAEQVRLRAEGTADSRFRNVVESVIALWRQRADEEAARDAVEGLLLRMESAVQAARAALDSDTPPANGWAQLLAALDPAAAVALAANNRGRWSATGTRSAEDRYSTDRGMYQ